MLFKELRTILLNKQMRRANETRSNAAKIYSMHAKHKHKCIRPTNKLLIKIKCNKNASVNANHNQLRCQSVMPMPIHFNSEKSMPIRPPIQFVTNLDMYLMWFNEVKLEKSEDTCSLGRPGLANQTGHVSMWLSFYLYKPVIVGEWSTQLAGVSTAVSKIHYNCEAPIYTCR